MSTRHTPGPWTCFLGSDERWRVHNPTIPNGRGMVCEVLAVANGPEERFANARGARANQ